LFTSLLMLLGALPATCCPQPLPLLHCAAFHAVQRSGDKEWDVLCFEIRKHVTEKFK